MLNVIKFFQFRYKFCLMSDNWFLYITQDQMGNIAMSQFHEINTRNT